MNGVIQPFRKRTGANCPICSAPMYIVYWHAGKHSFMCLKCHFGFNYND